jgi:phosphatidylethanolamine/phosphatidyl-N-methylethanolamine N-methyltransferase
MLLNTLRDGRSVFFHEFLKHPLQIGSIIPSSRFLERHIIEVAGVRSATTIVELGPGTGGTTRAILRAMAPHAKLLSIEINPNFHALVSCMEDDRLIAHLGNAHGLKEIIYMYGLGVPEVVISGIPFSTMSHSSGSQILETISSVLGPGGRFVAYQVSKRVASLCQPFFGPGRVEMELFNIPPMRVYRWEKNGD